MHKLLSNLESEFYFEPDVETANIIFETPFFEGQPAKPALRCIIRIEEADFKKYADFLAGRITEIKLNAVTVEIKCDETFATKRDKDFYPMENQSSFDYINKTSN